MALEAEADLDKADGNGNTPLMTAARVDQTAAVEWLLGRGADWRLTANDGKTALDCGKMEGEAKAGPCSRCGSRSTHKMVRTEVVAAVNRFISPV